MKSRIKLIIINTKWHALTALKILKKLENIITPKHRLIWNSNSTFNFFQVLFISKGKLLFGSSPSNRVNDSIWSSNHINMHCSCQSVHNRQLYKAIQFKRHQYKARPRVILPGAPKTSSRMPYCSEKKKGRKTNKMQRFLCEKNSYRTWTDLVYY